MIRIHLPEPEAQRLELLFRSTEDRRQCPPQDIATDLGIHRRSVSRWLNAFERGLDGLQPRHAPGASAKIPATLADEVRRWVIDGPAKQGLDRAG